MKLIQGRLDEHLSSRILYGFLYKNEDFSGKKISVNRIHLHNRLKVIFFLEINTKFQCCKCIRLIRFCPTANAMKELSMFYIIHFSFWLQWKKQKKMFPMSFMYSLSQLHSIVGLASSHIWRLRTSHFDTECFQFFFCFTFAFVLYSLLMLKIDWIIGFYAIEQKKKPKT